jgi:hypothetical protein
MLASERRACRVSGTTGGDMKGRFVASLPDATESRAAWVVWMLAGLWLGGAIVSEWVYVDSMAVVIGGPRWALDYVVPLVVCAMTAAFLAWCARVATRRLGMPQAVWIAVTLPSVWVWVLSISRVTNWNLYPLLTLPAWVSATVLVGWLVFRFVPSGGTAKVRKPTDETTRTDA